MHLALTINCHCVPSKLYLKPSIMVHILQVVRQGATRYSSFMPQLTILPRSYVDLAATTMQTHGDPPYLQILALQMECSDHTL
jgi:hypothetical protein